MRAQEFQNLKAGDRVRRVNMPVDSHLLIHSVETLDKGTPVECKMAYFGPAKRKVITDLFLPTAREHFSHWEVVA